MSDDLPDPSTPDAAVEAELRQLGIDPAALEQRTLDTVARARAERAVDDFNRMLEFMLWLTDMATDRRRGR